MRNEATEPNVYLVPRPRQVEMKKGTCQLDGVIGVQPPPHATEEESFAIAQLVQSLRDQWHLSVNPGAEGDVSIVFVRSEHVPPQGYELTVEAQAISIHFSDAAGAYYAVQTLRQCLVRHGGRTGVACQRIDDAPALKYRAAHYDTKHHQPTADYLRTLIEELAHYKINVLVWEWEDKLAYRKHPKIGAPGAFTIAQMREFTAYARQHHVQLVPLVQGLGHVSFILKHSEYRRLREIPDSNWEFCPQREETYELLFNLWDEAIEATPGSEFVHIGSDETYELGEGEACGCKAKADEIGKDGLMRIFIHRCVEHLEKRGRKVLSWGGEWQAGAAQQPPRSMIHVNSSDTDYLRASRQAGHPGWVYAPNPGITPLFLPYFPTVMYSIWQDWPGRIHSDFAETSNAIGCAARACAVDGSITTTWDDSGLHMQCWMPRLICGAEFSWNPMQRDIDEWADGFFKNYFGPQASHVRELFTILQGSAEFYDDTFERRVWHFGDIGKMSLPDFPRGDLEFSDFWRRQNGRVLAPARRQCQLLDRALAIIDGNLARPVKHAYDLQVMRTCARLMRHNADLVLMLANLEEHLAAAQRFHYLDRTAALGHLEQMRTLIAKHLHDRQEIFDELVSTWEQTRLPKGLSLPTSPYTFARDRARHFANRTPDMSYLIIDEQKLNLEDYLSRLERYILDYQQTR